MNLSLQDGGSIAIEEFDGERAHGVADRALPPGSRPEGSIESRRVRLKVERCSAREGHFAVRIRFIDLERDLREKILADVAQPPEGTKR